MSDIGRRTSTNLNRTMVEGMIWQTSARFGVRVLGLVGTLVLARMLTPADFGLVAVAAAIVTFLELFAEFGFSTALIRHPQLTDAHVDTVWTMNVALGAAAAMIIVASAPWVAAYYRDDRLAPVLYCLAFATLIESARNMATVRFRREFFFWKDVTLQLSQKLAVVCVSIPLAYSFRTYWAIVAGMLAGSFATVVLGYLMLPRRPRFTLERWRELIGFSKWTLFGTVLRFGRDRASSLILGRSLDPNSVGLFAMSQSYASLPTTELQAPIAYATLPGYSRMIESPEELRRSFSRVMGLSAVAIMPIGILVAALSAPIVRIILGERWSAAATAFGILAAAGALRALTASSDSLHYALGQPKYQVLTLLPQVVAIIPMLILASRLWGIDGAAWAYFWQTVVVVLPVTFFVVLRTTPIGPRDLFAPVWRATVAAALMFVAVRIAVGEASASGLGSSIAIVAKGGFTGVLVYIVATTVLWKLSGSPPGAEAILYDRARQRLRVTGGRS